LHHYLSLQPRKGDVPIGDKLSNRPGRLITRPASRATSGGNPELSEAFCNLRKSREEFEKDIENDRSIFRCRRIVAKVPGRSPAASGLYQVRPRPFRRVSERLIVQRTRPIRREISTSMQPERGRRRFVAHHPRPVVGRGIAEGSTVPSPWPSGVASRTSPVPRWS